MAKIEQVEVLEFAHTVQFRYDGDGVRLRDAVVPARTTKRFAVRLRCDDGVEGAYIVLWSAPPYAVRQVTALAGSLVGMDVAQRELIWDRANRMLGKTDRIGVGAIDIALWDAAGRAAGVPIADLLGRYRDRLPAYCSTVGGGHGLGALASADSYRAYAEKCVEDGFLAYKIHGPGTGDVRAEIAALEASSEGAAGRMDIMTDPGKSLRTLADALALGRACDDVGAYWWEDPMRDDAAFGHRILRQRVRTPLLMTEFVRGLEQRVAFALEGGTDFLRSDPELDMGITGVMKTAHAAEALGIDLEVHASGPAQRHCMAAIRNTNYYELGLLDPETGNPLHPPVYTDDYTEDVTALGPDGCVGVPTGPGLGVSYDWDYIEAHLTDRAVYT